MFKSLIVGMLLVEAKSILGLLLLVKMHDFIKFFLWEVSNEKSYN